MYILVRAYLLIIDKKAKAIIAEYLNGNILGLVRGKVLEYKGVQGRKETGIADIFVKKIEVYNERTIEVE